MILLDTHIWIWMVQGDPRIVPHREVLERHRNDGYAVSDFSCWEVAMLVAKRRLTLPFDVTEWVARAASYSGLEMIPVTSTILVASVRLPEPFHPDPADRIIVATAINWDLPLLTEDRDILAYPFVGKA